MIGNLRGTLIDRSGNMVVIDCGGVGYLAMVSSYTLASLAPVGAEVSLRVYTQVLENKIALYAFGCAQERELFDLLITVKKVGPSSAMGILSGGAGPVDIARLIAGEHLAGLTKLRGVGKKTAEMIVVELQDKCELMLATWGAGGGDATGDAFDAGPKLVRAPILDDVASALAKLGWRPTEADKAVADLTVSAEATLESLLRQALQAMPR